MSAANLQSGITGTDTPLIWGLEPIIEKVDMLMEVERMVLDPNHRLPALKVRSFVRFLAQMSHHLVTVTIADGTSFLTDCR